MKFEVEVISEEIIKPSSHTPDHLRHYKLSYLDQISPKTYNPLVLFYELNNESNMAEISSRIKKSLSEALALYYPLVGRVKDDRFVDCNDEGIPFTEARVISPSDLSDAMKNPSPSELTKLLPFELHKLNEFAAGVRLNIFPRGGVAVGICVSHQLADALSCIAFLKAWAALSRGGNTSVEKPQFVSAELFPPRDDPEFDASAGVTTTVVSKRFSFSATKIKAVREKYGGGVSRVEALSAFISSRIVAVTRQVGSAFVVVHPVNIRARLDRPLPENSFGNLYRCAFTMLGDGDEGGDRAVKRMREEIGKVDAGYLRKVRESREDENVKKAIEEAKRVGVEGGRLIVLSFTSLCRFPLYEADFGWGQPLWVSSATMSFNNLVGFMDSRDGRGIEAYIGLEEEHMAKLEADHEFLKYIST